MSERDLIGDQGFRPQVWIGSTDKAELLASIVGWAVGCENEEENQEAVNQLKRDGLITTRQHRTPNGDGWTAYALTDAGFYELRQIASGTRYDDAVCAHEFYLRGEVAA